MYDGFRLSRRGRFAPGLYVFWGLIVMVLAGAVAGEDMAGGVEIVPPPTSGYVVSAPAAGGDVAAVFRRAARGEALRVVAVGGSITQSGGGWIGDWLRQAFPDSETTVYNAGMSATGSQLAVFRMERDVLSHQPDLVLAEFAVNDGGQPEALTRWTVESFVRRLKTLPNPPAVVLMEMASRQRNTTPPQRAVAEHYGLLNLDLDKAVKTALARSGQSWAALLSDDVHMNAAGNRFYAAAIAAALEPLRLRAARDGGDIPPPAVAETLPPPLSDRLLLMNGRMAAVAPGPGWKTEARVPGWWDRFFLGAAIPERPDAVLTLTFRGTAGGLVYAMDNKRYGEMLVSVDGQPPQRIDTGVRSGYSAVFFRDLAPGGHTLSVRLSPDTPDKTLFLGYLLSGGDEAPGRGNAPKGPWTFTEENLRALRTTRAKASQFLWRDSGWSDRPTAELDFGRDIRPLLDRDPPADSAGAEWRVAGGDEYRVDVARLHGHKDRGFSWARTVLRVPEARSAQLEVSADYFARLYVNGRPAGSLEGGHSPQQRYSFPVGLRAGDNEILVKLHAGSLGYSFSLGVCQADDGTVFALPAAP